MSKASTRKSIKDKAEGCGWNLLGSYDGPEVHSDTYNRQDSEELVVVKYYPDSGMVKAVELYTLDTGTVSWEDGPVKRDMVFEMLGGLQSDRLAMAQQKVVQ